MDLNLKIAVKAGLVKRLELGIDHRQGGQMDEMGRRRGGRCQHLHKGVHLGTVGQVHIKGTNLTGEAGAEVGQLFQIAAALGQHSRVGRGADQKPLNQRAAHIAGGTGDKIGISHDFLLTVVGAARGAISPVRP